MLLGQNMFLRPHLLPTAAAAAAAAAAAVHIECIVARAPIASESNLSHPAGLSDNVFGGKRASFMGHSFSRQYARRALLEVFSSAALNPESTKHSWAVQPDFTGSEDLAQELGNFRRQFAVERDCWKGTGNASPPPPVSRHSSPPLPSAPRRPQQINTRARKDTMNAPVATVQFVSS